MKKILLVADYFGAWPAWFEVFLASCAANTSIDWLIHTDCPLPKDPPGNVTFKSMPLDEYCTRASNRLGIEFRPKALTNVANLRPTYGELHAEYIDGYDFFGWCDIDVIFGNLRKFLSDLVLSHNLIATSAICTGHLGLLRNNQKYRQMFRDIPEWKQRMARQDSTPWAESCDEAWLTRLCSPIPRFRHEAEKAGVPHDRLDLYRDDNFFVEQWSTPFTPGPWRDSEALHPEVWYWTRESLTNCRDGERSFPYLHLMNFKAQRHIDQELYGLQQTWSTSQRLQDEELLAADVVRISRNGLQGVRALEAEKERGQLQRCRSEARKVDYNNAADFREAVRRFASMGAHFSSNTLVDPAGVVPAQLRRALWHAQVAAKQSNFIPSMARPISGATQCG